MKGCVSPLIFGDLSTLLYAMDIDLKISLTSVDAMAEVGLLLQENNRKLTKCLN